MPGILSLIAMILTLAVSGYFTKKHNEKVTHDELEIQLAVNKKFVCPLHPQVIKETEGYCSICGSPLNEVIVQFNIDSDTSLTSFTNQQSGLLAQ